MSKSKDSAASDIVLNYLTKQNRPYSVIDIFNNLHKEIGKTLVGKVLDQLVADGKIKEKVYGKQKVYYADQSQFPQLDKEDLAKMDAEIINLTQTLTELEQSIKSKEVEVTNLLNSLTTSNAEKQLASLDEDIAALKTKLSEFQSSQAKPISPAEKEAAEKICEKYNKEYRKRKRIANDVIDAVLENYPKSKKEFFEEVGLELENN